MALRDVADLADTASRLLELAGRTSRTTDIHPREDRYTDIVEALQAAADAAHRAAALVIDTARQA